MPPATTTDDVLDVVRLINAVLHIALLAGIGVLTWQLRRTSERIGVELERLFATLPAAELRQYLVDLWRADASARVGILLWWAGGVLVTLLGTLERIGLAVLPSPALAPLLTATLAGGASRVWFRVVAWWKRERSG